MSGAVIGRIRPAKTTFRPNGVGRFLRSLYPADTAKRVSRDTGLSVHTVNRYLRTEPDAPSASALARLIHAYGPEFLLAVMPEPPAWLSAAFRAEQARKLRLQQAAIEHELDALNRNREPHDI